MCANGTSRAKCLFINVPTYALPGYVPCCVFRGGGGVSAIPMLSESIGPIFKNQPKFDTTVLERTEYKEN